METKKRKGRRRLRHSVRALHGSGADTAAHIPECKSPTEADPGPSPSGLEQGSSSHSLVPRQSKSLSRLSGRRSHCHSRSPSPARMFCQREQHDLKVLNDRLWSHADHVRQLQGENARLKLQLEAAYDLVRRETQNVRTVQAAELRRVQEMLDSANEAKSRLETEHEEMNLQKIVLEERLNQNEAQLVTLTEKLKHPLDLADECNRLKAELESTSRSFHESQEDVKRLSSELLQEKRIGKRLEGEARSYKEGYLKEVEAVNARFSQHVQQADETLEASYDNTVAEVRNQYKRDLEGLRAELTFSYQSKLVDLKVTCEHAQADVMCLKRELKTFRADDEKLRSQITQFKADKAALQVQLSDAQERNEYLKDSLEKQRCQGQREIALLTQELVEVREDLSEIGGVNTRLEEEIKSYCEILNGLEEKTQAAGVPKERRWFPRLSGGDTKASTEADGAKRKLSSLAESLVGSVEDSQTRLWDSRDLSTKSKVDFFRANEFSQGIEIHEVDTEGKYITLVNSTEHTTDLCLWTVKQTNCLGQEVTFNIPSQVLLSRGKQLTLWSSGAQEPTTDNQVPCTDDQQHPEADGVTSPDSGTTDATTTSTPLLPDLVSELDDGFEMVLSSGKSWLELRQTLSVRVEDGDGQLQAKCDVTRITEDDDEGGFSDETGVSAKKPRLSLSQSLFSWPLCARPSLQTSMATTKLEVNTTSDRAGSDGLPHKNEQRDVCQESSTYLCSMTAVDRQRRNKISYPKEEMCYQDKDACIVM
ncbi:lamin-L(III) [Aplysia californica]|uniref:Lamin-L(III) n=1 Tax=Aplysia californica TaxID=6500 RepID=A0ABM1ABX8_APLCA|nr:lamin-L(III) [Aplysia californica]